MDGSSKVTVEYHDPSGLFPVISEQLATRLPLRNLHWKSPTRPLRSIDSLHLNFVPSRESQDDATSSSSAPSSGPGQGAGHEGQQNVEAGKPPAKERRHQIPGLRQTPYLKLYLLRCDDNESYKAISRKAIRDWINAHTPPSQKSSSSKQENHDAFEWMIIHVVLPDTGAQTQPRFYGSSKSNSEEGKEKSSGSSRWPGRGSTSIFEKIRADFNVSSKSAPDRVCQIRVEKNAVPPHMLPQPVGFTGTPYSESPQEHSNAWADVISKFKNLILISFDLRVREYEEDIREKDAQRALPGWNFCTFFILKEGLARGFESVGLVDDALVGYDELSIGLDTVVRDQAADATTSPGGAFLPYTDDLLQQLTALANDTPDKSTAVGFGQKPISSTKKLYRELILSNNISVYDFQCYIFSRQLALLLRLGNAHTARAELASKLRTTSMPAVQQASMDDSTVGTRGGPVRDEAMDLLSLAEVCQRALAFITNVARVMREDVIAGARSSSLDHISTVVDGLVSSWTYAVSQQVLDETMTSQLPVSMVSRRTETTSSSKVLSHRGSGQEQKTAVSEPKTLMHPARTSSLPPRRGSLGTEPPYAQLSSASHITFDHGRFPEPAQPATKTGAVSDQSGANELAMHRGELYLLQRRLLEHVGDMLGWKIGWASAAIEDMLGRQSFTDVDLDADGDAKDARHTDTVRPASGPYGLCMPALSEAANSIDRFRGLWERLSDLAIKHYMAAGLHSSSERILGDLAALKYETNDFKAASMYFSRMAPTFGAIKWSYIETAMLKMYARCLKELDKKDEYVLIVLQLLAKSVAKEQEKMRVRIGTNRSVAGLPKPLLPDWLDDDRIDAEGYLDQVVSVSKHLPKSVEALMTSYFSGLTIEPHIHHYESPGKDGFRLLLRFRHLLEDDLRADSIRVRLISASSLQQTELWLECIDVPVAKRGVETAAWLESNVSTYGQFLYDRIVIQAGNVVFLHEPLSKPGTTTALGITMPTAAAVRATRNSRVLVFPRDKAFHADLMLANMIEIDARKWVEVILNSGQNDVRRAVIKLRSGSAGLRLRTADASIISGDIALGDRSQPGTLIVDDFAADGKAKIRVPYELENQLPELSIRLEITYTTGNGEFQFYAPTTISLELPLDVSVHDTFKASAVFSKFDIKTKSQVPLEVLNVRLEGKDAYKVRCGLIKFQPMLVFAKQPASLVYRITKSDLGLTNVPLQLTVQYQCLDERIVSEAEKALRIDLTTSSFAQLVRALIPFFKERLQSRLLGEAMERTGLLQTVQMPSFEEIGWSEYVDQIHPSAVEGLSDWLRSWHENHQHLPLPFGVMSETSESNSILIRVPLPILPVLHTATLKLHNAQHPSTHASAVATLGEPLTATLSLTHTRRWAAAASAGTEKDRLLEFLLEVDANPDIWVVGGSRRVRFSAIEGEEKTFDLILMPLKTGHLLLPNVEVKPVPPRKQQHAQEDSVEIPAPVTEGEQEIVACETDYRNSGESVLIIGDWQSTSIRIVGGEDGRSGVDFVGGERNTHKELA